MTNEGLWLQERIERYKAMVRQIHDERALEALEQLIAEAKQQMRERTGGSELKR